MGCVMCIGQDERRIAHAAGHRARFLELRKDGQVGLVGWLRETSRSPYVLILPQRVERKKEPLNGECWPGYWRRPEDHRKASRLSGFPFDDVAVVFVDAQTSVPTNGYSAKTNQENKTASKTSRRSPLRSPNCPSMRDRSLCHRQRSASFKTYLYTPARTPPHLL
ncbi:hypothetical protein BDV95DRAFT_286412 [Massariosphaeria phaeospora]|uniref:Uncharacterized protein n=1 Tax=Massariosphaeria phaeospora TaxID=100035 RepID=A0A7C8IGP9_9PLEO|nr:hypothetical protein BDV95DRAFT_286412 [Massariosphaeria phaeospora]